MVGGLRHGVLSFLHTVVEKSMNFIKVDGEVRTHKLVTSVSG